MRGVIGVVLALTDIQRHVVETNHAHKLAVDFQKLLRIVEHLVRPLRRQGHVGGRRRHRDLNLSHRLPRGAFLAGASALPSDANDEHSRQHNKSGSARKLDQKPPAPLPFPAISRTHYFANSLRFLSAMATPASAAAHSPATAAVDTTESPSSGVTEESSQIVLP